MVELVQARYIGLDGSLGYRVNQTYQFMLETSPHGPQVVIERPDEPDTRCPYDNAIAFLQNWADVKVDPAATPVPARSSGEMAALAAIDPGLAAVYYVDSKGKDHIIAELTEPHLINIARKLWRTGRNNEGITAELKRRGIEIKEHLTKEDLE